jgi:hypothetical protein
MELLGPNEFEPGTAAPISGKYELQHLLGNRTGEYVDLAIGQALPQHRVAGSGRPVAGSARLGLRFGSQARREAVV